MSEISSFPSHLAPKKRIHICTICKKEFEWDESLGSCYISKFILKGKGYDCHETEKIEAKFCTKICANLYPNKPK